MDWQRRTWRDLDKTLSGPQQTLGDVGSTVKKTRENWMKPWTGLHKTSGKPQKAVMKC